MDTCFEGVHACILTRMYWYPLKQSDNVLTEHLICTREQMRLDENATSVHHLTPWPMTNELSDYPVCIF